ncbi:MAG: hypothetical protein DID90_2727554643 [Candidatus Nitrotoga sp. LAW]|nr:MAG: hypothetical protein DID90_2727554643 [Candidatus Nitrotoga sp. LAW]
MHAWHVSTLFIHRKPHTTTIPVNLRAIPEVRKWFVQLFKAWPYWSFFASRIDQTVPLVLTLLLSGETVAGEPSMAGWSFDYSSMLQGAQKRLSAVYSRNDIHKFCHSLLQAMRCRFQKIVRFDLVSKGLVQREAFLKIADRQIVTCGNNRGICEASIP